MSVDVMWVFIWSARFNHIEEDCDKALAVDDDIVDDDSVDDASVNVIM